MIVEFLVEARSELIDAVAYYEGELAGLGQRFWDELDEHFSWIGEKHEVPLLRPGAMARTSRIPLVRSSLRGRTRRSRPASRRPPGGTARGRSGWAAAKQGSES